jgi:hypothetical protein
MPTIKMFLRNKNDSTFEASRAFKKLLVFCYHQSKSKNYNHDKDDNDYGGYNEQGKFSEYLSVSAGSLHVGQCF